MIWDTFMLNDELDMLECRLWTLEDVVDRFVIAEAAVTHGGCTPKPFHYRENADRFKQWHDKIRYVPIPSSAMPASQDPWHREHAQRDHCMYGMQGATAGDLVMHGDIDEIPKPEVVEWMGAYLQQPATLNMRIHMYAVDWQSPRIELATVVRRGVPPSFSEFRGGKHGYTQIGDAGWHLTWLGGVERNRDKLNTHCHSEMRPHEREIAYSGRAYRTGYTHGDEQQFPVEVDESWPQYIRERRCPPEWFRPRSE